MTCACCRRRRGECKHHEQAKAENQGSLVHDFLLCRFPEAAPPAFAPTDSRTRAALHHDATTGTTSTPGARSQRSRTSRTQSTAALVPRTAAAPTQREVDPPIRSATGPATA